MYRRVLRLELGRHADDAGTANVVVVAGEFESVPAAEIMRPSLVAAWPVCVVRRGRRRERRRPERPVTAKVAGTVVRGGGG